MQRAGAVPLLIPPDADVAAEPDLLLDVVDAVLLSGGADLDPATYGAAPDPCLEETAPDRDAMELALVRRALERDIPVLGVCRGLQVLNIAAGGTLHQHLPDVLGHDGHRRRIGSFTHNRHELVVRAGSRVHAVERSTVITAASHHHQGVDRLGAGLTVTAHAPVDGLPEALEAPDRRFAVAVQWHPEIEEEAALIAALVAAARGATLAGPPASRRRPPLAVATSPTERTP